MEPIIGAFLAGAAFNRLIPENSPLMTRVQFAGNTLFIPFFLISVGMLVDPRALLTSSHGWLVGTTMVVTVVLTKYAAAHLTRWLYGYDRASGQVMFGLTVVQAAATLAAVVVGYNLKIFDEAVLNGAIAMILVSCILGAWAVERYGRRMAAEAPVQRTASIVEQRLLVSVANPESALRLLDLAFLLRNPAMPGGIYPLTIVRDRGNTDEAVANGEKLLGRCLAHAASADMPLTPGLRVAVNVSDGIVHAARELRSTTVIFGWTGEKSASIRIFGSVMHHLVINCPSRLLFSRLVRPLNTTERLLVPFPPLASRRRDFPELVLDLKTLAQRIGAELRVYVVKDEAATLLPPIENAKPVCRTSVVQAATWKDVRQVLFSEILPDDVILLPSDRRSGVLWTPALDHLPELIAERFPESNLLVDYPSLPAPERDTIEHPVKTDDGFPFLLPIDLGPGVPLERALQRMADAAFPAFPDLARAAFEHLLSSANAYPVELAPGMVLLHARFGNPEQPMLMVCHAPGGWPVPNLPTPPRIVLVLLGSQSQKPEQHLKTLSLVARRMHEAGRKAEFQAAKSAEEICALLGKKGQPAREAESAPRKNR
jgi:mannitol/fructose-specific phosphotransferase system IIA component (Ntr-type)